MPRVYTSRLRSLGLAGAFAAIYEKCVIRRGPDECWGWAGAIHEYGYGTLGVWDSGRAHMSTAHRVAYEITHGPLPSSVDVMHLCHTAECSNLWHLQKGTRKQNMQTSRASGRLQRKIPLADMPTIRARRSAGEHLRVIAADYHCTPQAVRHMLLYGVA